MKIINSKKSGVVVKNNALRKSGLDIVGDVEWGTHLCQFYKTKEDLIDILVPYFKAGLKNNEFCMWVTSEHLTAKDARAALKKVVKNLDEYIKKGQIEIFDYSQWYAKTGRFDADKVLEGWVEKEKQALKKGFEGLRLTGNTFWLEKKDWKKFTDYEATVNSVIGKYRMLAICSYSLDKCQASEVIDVVNNHQFALIRKEGKWTLLESFERKLAEETLKGSEEKYRNLFEVSPDSIMTFDMKGVITSCNAASIKLSGHSKNELIGKHFSKIGALRTNDIPKYLKMLGSVIRGKTLEPFEIVWKDKNGSFHFGDVHLGLIREGGRLKGLQAIMRDITERKKTEEELKESEEKFNMLFKYAPDAYSIHDIGGRFISINKAAEKLIGYEEKEVIGKSFSELKLLPKYGIQKTFSGTAGGILGKSIGSGEFTLNRKDGSQVVVETRAIPVRIGGETFVLVIEHDITERKKIEAIVREEKNKLEQYFNIIGAIIIFFNRDGKIILINKKGCEILGYELKEILKKNWFTDFVSKEDKIKTRAFVKKLIEDKSNQIQYFENHILTKNGKKIFVNWSNIVVEDESGKTSIVLGTGLDITELMESRITINDLNKINSLKDDFLNIAAHELRTPLTSIIGFSEIMKEQKLFCNPEQKNYTNIIYEESSRLAGIVKRILMITRFESGREIIKFEPINLSNFISSFLIKLNIIANKEKSKVIANIEKENIIIKSDEEKISEVIYNFIDNALRYGLDEQVIVISVTKPNKKWVRIAVKNQGKGIPPEKLNQLFNKFSQLESSLVRSQEGTGLGLYICKIIIDSLGGKIGVESEPNKGSTFYFTLPIENVATQKRDLDLKAV